MKAMLSVIFFILLVLTQPVFAEPVKILPFGTWTEGSDGRVSYRYDLWFDLIDAGFDVDFVGNKTNPGSVNMNLYPDYLTGFDRNHYGLEGTSSPDMLSILKNQSATYNPDIVLLWMGPYDLLTQGASGVTNAKFAIPDAIKGIRQFTPGAAILLALCSPATPLDAADVAALNDAIVAIASEMNTPESPIIVVDHVTGFDPVGMMYDKHHHNRVGEAWVAKNWFKVLASIMSKSEPPKPNNEGNSITVAPTGIDDTANIQFALDKATTEGFSTVKLEADTYFISGIVIEDFKGTLEGVTNAATIIEVLDDSINCEGMENAGQTSSVIKFISGEPRIRFMTITADQPCTSGNRIESTLHFTGASANGASCANDVIFGSVDRVALDGTDVVTGPVNAVLVSAEGNHLGGCKQTLLGTFKLNRSDISSFSTGLQTTMKAGAQVDVNFNNFEDNINAVWLQDTNQNTTITNNRISAVDVSVSGSKGVVIRTQSPTAPAATRVVINKNEFTVSSTSNAVSYAIDGSQSGRIANVSSVITNNTFNLGGGNTRGVSLSDISNAHVSTNRFTGDGETAVHVFGTEPVSGWTVTANKGMGSFNSTGPDVFLGPTSSECIVGAGQAAVVNNSGIDNTILTQF